MYVFGENEGVITWIVAEHEEQATSIFEYITDIKVENDCENPNEYVRETSPEETMVYYHDGRNSEENTMENLIKKYCYKPDVFATSEF